MRKVECLLWNQLVGKKVSKIIYTLDPISINDIKPLTFLNQTANFGPHGTLSALKEIIHVLIIQQSNDRQSHMIY